nr:immunoglobulin light chain junction region [Macaca mulatta]MOX25083.1 immunoglobulin light chain junction region [Macaca mulatta]MOX26764.1 immunoglobulin light chain junction region [Macaca mulatta]MOY04587.1 immunoglobulin light chain junction region [Macaca mulatta]
CMQALDLYSF